MLLTTVILIETTCQQRVCVFCVNIPPLAGEKNAYATAHPDLHQILRVILFHARRPCELLLLFEILHSHLVPVHDDQCQKHNQGQCDQPDVSGEVGVQQVYVLIQKLHMIVDFEKLVVNVLDI